MLPSPDQRRQARLQRNLRWYKRAVQLTPYGIIIGVILLIRAIWIDDSTNPANDLLSALILLGALVYVYYAVRQRYSELLSEQQQQNSNRKLQEQKNKIK